MTTRRLVLAALSSLVLGCWPLRSRPTPHDERRAETTRPERLLVGRPGCPTSSGLKRQEGGVTKTTTIDRVKVTARSARAAAPCRGRRRPPTSPSSRPRSRTSRPTRARPTRCSIAAGPAFCVGPPRKIVQLADELIFSTICRRHLPRDPTDGRAHRADANPADHGDRWGSGKVTCW